MRVTKEQFIAIQSRREAAILGKRSKYGNRKKEVDGRTFDSTREANRYQQLKIMEAAGDISELTCQVPVACVINHRHVCDYYADFTYYRKGSAAKTYEDSKGKRTDVYIIKRKLVAACTGIEITET